MRDGMKHVCLAQALVVLEGFACNQKSLRPVLSQHITAGAMLEAADKVSVELPCSPLVDLPL